MSKLKNVYNEFITSKEKNKAKVNQRIMIIKEKETKKRNFFNFATTIFASILILIGEYYYFNNNTETLDNNPNNLSVITIEGVEYYNNYDMGVNMNKVPKSSIYGYAIKEDKNSYKIVSLHHDGTIFDLVAIDDKLERRSSGGTNLSEHYKLTIADDKLYFIRLAYYNSLSPGKDNSNVVEGKNQKYDLEVYFIDTKDEHPKLELLLQKGDQTGIYYDIRGIMIHDSNLYYFDQYSDNNTIEALKLGETYHENQDIRLTEKIRGYHINDNVLYVLYGDVEYKYAIVDFYDKDSNGHNLTTLISEDEYKDKYDYKKMITSNGHIHYFDTYNRYTKLLTNNIEVKVEGFESNEKGVGFVGNKLLVDNKEVYQYDSTFDTGITLLSTEGNKVNFCIGAGSYCPLKDNYYSYDIETGEIENNSDVFNYFLLIYVTE